MPDIAYCNRILKRIAVEVGIDKAVTYHMGRHSFATTNALMQGIRIEVVSRMLGHTNIKTTQIYAKVTDDMLAKGFDEMADIYTASHDKKRNNSCLRSSVFIPSAQHIVPQSIVEPTCEQNRDGLFSHTVLL